MGLLGAVAGLGSALVGTSVRTSWALTCASASVTTGLAHTVVQAAAAPVVRLAADSGGAPTRQVWSVPGRAQIQVWGLDTAASPVVGAAVEEALSGFSGVSWVRVDAVTRRVGVRFDARLGDVAKLVGVVAAAETAAGVTSAGYGHGEPSFPGDSGPVTMQAWALVADVVGLSAAVAGWATRLPSLPGSAAAAVVLVDSQPRLRRVLETQIGPAGTDLALAVTNAVVHGLTQGTSTLLVDAGQRAQALLAARARRDGFTAREAELSGPDRPATTHGLDRVSRPAPVPGGPVEAYADRAATGSLLAAGGLLAATGNLDLAGRVVLIGAPKAARAAREGFADTLSAGLSRRGVVVVDPAALRRLDRVDTVVVDTRVLHGDRPVVLSASTRAEHWSREHVWSAAQRLLEGGPELPVPPPRGRHRHRLVLQGSTAPQNGDGLSRRVLVEDGAVVGDVVVGTELDPYADAVLTATQSAGLRLVLTHDAGASDLAGRADEVLTDTEPLTVHLRRLQADGQVVALVSALEQALAAADVGIGIVPPVGRVPWAADLLCGPGLGDVPRVLAAVPAARTASTRGVTSAMAATFLGGLLTAVGGRAQTARAVVPVTTAAGVSLLAGTLTARQIHRAPPPVPVWHTPWHALEADEVLTRLPPPRQVSGVGASTPARRWSVPVAVLSPLGAVIRNVAAELADPLTPVLATGAAASAVIGAPIDAVLVGGVLAANAVISGMQRMRADQALRALLLDQQLPARLLDAAAPGSGRPRRPQTHRVPARSLLPGQWIEVRAGDVVPADARLLAEDGLEVDEASLTGESGAVGKQTHATPGAELPERACMVYEGSTVIAGTAQAVVVAVGPATEAGRALALAAGAAAPAGMQARLEELTRRGLPITLLGGAAVTGLALLRRQPLPQALASGVSVAVAAVPEGLPLVATVAQLGAARRLSARGVLVRSARTVEALGRVDTVCFDKTGTLTEGRLRLARLAGVNRQWAPDAPQGRRILLDAVRACPQPEPGTQAAHATDQAILDAARGLGPTSRDESWTELAELPFQSDRGYSASVGRTATSLRLVVKGAPEILLPRCTHERDDSGKRALNRAARERATAMVHALAGQGLRVLAVARRNISDVLPEEHDPTNRADPEELTEDLTLLGFVALADIPRPQAAPTLAALRTAGFATVMITGDHPVTAHAIAHDLGIPADRVVTGRTRRTRRTRAHRTGRSVPGVRPGLARAEAADHR